MNGSLILREEEEVSLEASLQMKPRNVVVEASAALLSGSDSRNESELEEAPLNIRPSRPFMLEEASLLPAGSMALASVFLTAMVCLFGVVVFWYCRKLRAEEGRRHKVTMTVDTKQLVFHNVDNSAQK
uniref:Uncharacterized protein n=1 Tax=Plectus sambesii TaxID=2011161 RepID=A0A914WJ57_9BILA